MNEKENLSYFEKHILAENNNKKYKEYMLTMLTEFIKNNLVSLSKEEIRNYFKIYGEKSIASYEKSYIRYSIVKDCFILTYQYEDNVLERDQYNYDVITDSSIKYTYNNSVYESGRVI